MLLIQERRAFNSSTNSCVSREVFCCVTEANATRSSPPVVTHIVTTFLYVNQIIVVYLFRMYNVVKLLTENVVTWSIQRPNSEQIRSYINQFSTLGILSVLVKTASEICIQLELVLSFDRERLVLTWYNTYNINVEFPSVNYQTGNSTFSRLSSFV